MCPTCSFFLVFGYLLVLSLVIGHPPEPVGTIACLQGETFIEQSNRLVEALQPGIAWLQMEEVFVVAAETFMRRARLTATGLQRELLNHVYYIYIMPESHLASNSTATTRLHGWTDTSLLRIHPSAHKQFGPQHNARPSAPLLTNEYQCILLGPSREGA